jgi:predicted amidophosphoribosyltransferase
MTNRDSGATQADSKSALRPRSCLVCLEKTTSEGQLCPACVAEGHRIENDMLIVNIGPRP